MENPYTFDPTNHRVVTNISKNNKVYMGTGALYMVSLHMYLRKYLRVDGNAVDSSVITFDTATR